MIFWKKFITYSAVGIGTETLTKLLIKQNASKSINESIKDFNENLIDVFENEDDKKNIF